MDIKKINSIVKHVKTPFYVYDSALMKEKYFVLRNNIPKEIEIFYAVKANPHKGVVSLFGELGTGCDVASAGELITALQSEVKPHKISFAGPGKTTEDLKLAVQKKIASINIESEDELVILEKLSNKMKQKTDISIRINPARGSLFAALRMGGGSQQFGIDERLVPRVVQRIRNSKHLNFLGIHMHTGSQILSETAIADNIKFLLDYCIELQDNMNLEIKMVNFGGGWGIPYYREQKELNVKYLGRLIADVFRSQNVASTFKNTRFIIEPGRFLIGESGIYVTKVLYKKKSAGKTFLIVDGGLHHNLAAAGLLGEGLKRNRIMGILGKPISNKKKIVTIAGCLCTPLDILACDISLPACEAGCYLYITCSGAYGYSASPLMFLSHPLPSEVIV